MSKSKAKRARLQRAAAASGASVQAQSAGSDQPEKLPNIGKPFKLLDMSRDVLFEVARYLQPIDLLNLCRVSKHARQIFMSKSLQWLWSVARSNVEPHPVPDPPRHISEPRLASFLFEKCCSDCRKKGIYDSIDYGIGVRLCRNCWSDNIKSGATLILEAQLEDVPCPLIYQLNIRETRFNKATRADNMDGDNYYQPQFEVVANTYKQLKDGDAETLRVFIQERHDIVREAREANVLFLEWHEKLKAEERKRLAQIVDRRSTSIKQRLYGLGYTDEDLPCFQWDNVLWNQWNVIVKKQKELTEEAWESDKPQLERIIQEYRNFILDTGTKAKDLRIRKRTTDVRRHYQQVIDSRDPGDGPYPTFQQLKTHDEVASLLTTDRGKVAIDLARFETEVVPLVEKLKTQGLQAVIDVMRAHYTGIGEDMVQASEDSATKLLHRATSLFKDPFATQDDCFYGFAALMERMRSQLVYCERSWSFYTQPPTSEDHKAVWDTAAGILKMLGLPLSTPYEAVNKKVICTCGRPDFTQPAEFSELVKHVSAEWAFCKALRLSYHESVDIGLCPSDHDINGSDVFVKLLENDEAPPVFSADKDLCDRISASVPHGGLRCKLCVELVTGGVDSFSSIKQSGAPGLLKALEPDELVWHVAYKHKRPATADDIFIPHQEDEGADEDPARTFTMPTSSDPDPEP